MPEDSSPLSIQKSLPGDSDICTILIHLESEVLEEGWGDLPCRKKGDVGTTLRVEPQPGVLYSIPEHLGSTTRNNTLPNPFTCSLCKRMLG